MTKKQAFKVVGLVLLIGLLAFGATHRFVTGVTLEQGSGEAFLSVYPELLRQVNGWNQPSGQENVITTDFYNVYTVTEKSLLFGTRTYHLLPFSVLVMEDGCWQTEFRVFADCPPEDAKFAIQSGCMEVIHLDDTVSGTSLQMLSNYRVEESVPGTGKMTFDAWWGKKPREPVVISFVPLSPEPAADGNLTIGITWNVSVRTGFVENEMTAPLTAVISVG